MYNVTYILYIYTIYIYTHTYIINILNICMYNYKQSSVYPDPYLGMK